MMMLLFQLHGSSCCLFMKTYLLALLQDNCIDLVCCAFLHKLSASEGNLFDDFFKLVP